MSTRCQANLNARIHVGKDGVPPSLPGCTVKDCPGLILLTGGVVTCGMSGAAIIPFVPAVP